MQSWDEVSNNHGNNSDPWRFDLNIEPLEWTWDWSRNLLQKIFNDDDDDLDDDNDEFDDDVFDDDNDDIYIMCVCVCVCHEKSSLPTSELSTWGAKWAARQPLLAVGRLWPSDDDDDDDDEDDDDDGDQVWSGGAVAGCHGKSPTPPCTASTGD